jgi:peptidoglycan/xylan/chitin deacetylase (PgdA/CDA1 family)
VLDNALPELRARHWPATIFVPVGAMGGAPAWEIECRDMPEQEIVATADALRRLDPELVSIGGHTLTHPHLPGLSPARARAEIAGCRSLINQTFGIDAGLFAFPYGEHDAASIDLCRKAGYRHVFTNLPYVVDPGSGGFVRGRVLVDPEDGPLEFYLKMAGAYAWMPYASMIKKCFGRLLRGR